MHGLIFVTWEKFLAEQFGASLLTRYRTAIGQTSSSGPLANRVYSDEMLLAGVGVACELTGASAETLLRKYGRYFIINELTSQLCAYLLSQVHNARSLLLTMSNAHAQLQRSSDNVAPPLFKYGTTSHNNNDLIISYDSPRQLCSVLVGAIEGAAERYGEKVTIIERSCMKHGGVICLFELRFSPHQETAKRAAVYQADLYREKRMLADFMLKFLPLENGFTLREIQEILRRNKLADQYLRPYRLLESLRLLEHVGLVSSTANGYGDDSAQRRYWRVPAYNQRNNIR